MDVRGTSEEDLCSSWCVVCAGPIAGEAAVSVLGPVCSTCGPRFPQCDQCDAILMESCHRFGNRVFCRNCVEEYPLCLTCGQLSPEYILELRGGTCSYCGDKLRCCAGCYRLVGFDWTPYGERWYCDDCLWATLGLCCWCLEPRSATERQGQDCLACRDSLVREHKDVQDLLEEAREYCQSEFGMRVTRRYHLLLADDAVLRNLPRSTQPQALGRKLLGLWNADKNTVWVGSPMPAWLTSSVLIHEHVHAWQHEHCPPQTLQLKEGLARWVERRALLNLGQVNMAQRLERSPCNIYGDGLRSCLELEERWGTAQFLERVRRMRSFSLWQRMLGILS